MQIYGNPQFGTPPTGFNYSEFLTGIHLIYFSGLAHGTPPSSQFFSSSPNNFMGYSQYPMQGLTGAMQQMNIGGPARRDSFGNSAPPPINIRPIQQPGPYYIMQTSPPNAPIASSPNQQMFCEFSQYPYYCNFLV
jgi:hypothetical protein